MFGNMMNNAPSLADIAAVTRNNEDGWGNGMAMMMWWPWILMMGMYGWGNGGFGGWGGFGGGNAGGAGSQFIEAAIQRGFDNQSVVQKLDGINNGICSLGYDQLAQMNGINTQVMQTGFGLQQGLNAVNVANMQNTNALSTQLANCCCENRQGQADIKYAMATDTCAITTAIQQAAQSIMQNDNANYRQLHDEQVALQMQNYKDQIAAQAQTINMLNLAQSQERQNTFIQGQFNALEDRLCPCPVPSYPAWPSATAYGAYGLYNGYGYGWGRSNCNCNSNNCCGSNSGCCNG